MKKFLIAALTSAALLMSSPAVEAGEVIAIGEGITRDMAIHNAMRTAIEQEIGAIIDSKTYVQNAQVIDDEIMSKSRGFVESYEILREWQDNGMFEVEIKANVRSEELRVDLMSNLQKKKIVEVNMNDPRIAVIAFDENGQEYAEVESEIIRSLKNNGFSRLVDLSQVNLAVKMRLRNADDDNALRQSLVNQFHFDDIVIANIKFDEALKFENTTAVLSVKMISMNTGEIIYAGTFTGGKQRMFSSVSSKRSIRLASRQAARALAKAALEEAAQVEQDIKILVTKNTLAKFGNLHELNKRIKDIQGVNDTFTRSLNNGTAEIDVNFDGTAYDLMTALERKGLNVIELNSDYIKI